MEHQNILHEKHNRIQWIDALRGLTILSMIAYHAMWDYVWLYDHDLAWFKGNPGYIWQQSICIIFILLAGFCMPFAKHPIRKGLILLACSLAISIITGIAEPDSQVHFGVLSLIGTGMILFTPVEKIPMMQEKEKEYAVRFTVLMLACLALFLLTRDVNRGLLGFYGVDFARVPHGIYRNQATAFLGFPFDGFRSSDYFSVLPWIFLFGTGYFGRKRYDAGPVHKDLKTRWLTPFCRIGRHSLLIYLAHQPVIMLLFMLIYGR